MGCSCSKKKPLVFVLGGPCCGKSTQCTKIAKDFGYVHLSAGDLMREEMEKESKGDENCEHLMKDGEPLPLDDTLKLLKKAMDKDVNSKGFVIDGFPRASEQTQALIARFEKKVGRPKMVIYLDCPKEVMEVRKKKLNSEAANDPKAPKDNHPKTIARNFEADEAQTMPVVSFYEKMNPDMVERVSTVLSPDEVYKVIRKSLGKTTKKK